MNCVVTAGPTYEPLDQVRRLTNLSTGRLGIELGGFLATRGHGVTLLVGEQATWRGERRVQRVIEFGTTADLGTRLQSLGGEPVDAVFHAAAVSDFTGGNLWQRSAGGQLTAVSAGKISSRLDNLLVELKPTMKLIARLRAWFPRAVLVGWKYEVDGDRAIALAAAERQLAECRTNGCVANGPAYGRGFGLVTGAGRCVHRDTAAELYAALEELLRPA
jgi:phosphopantothenoylcysteine decarboxylase/phosphopantothenate--cysteine ligase